MKFWTTQNKKFVMTFALLISAWHVMSMGSNPLSLPELSARLSSPLLGGFSLLNLAGAALLFVVYMLWTEY